MSKSKKVPDMLCPLWMMTFGDCMSLLVTFFVMLIAFTNIETEQLMDMIGAMKGALGMTPGKIESYDKIPVMSSFERIRGTAEERTWLSVDEMSAIIPDITMAFEELRSSKTKGVDDVFVVRMMEEGMAFIIQTHSIFEEGTAIPLPEYSELWAQVARFTKGMVNEIRIVGVVPKGTKINNHGIRTTWGLGVERAQVVMKILADIGGFESSRFGIGGEESVAVGDGVATDLPAERVEIIVIGKKALRDITPGEIVVKDRWK